MDLFEHQAKELFAKYGVAVPAGKVAWSPEEAEAAAAEVGGGRRGRGRLPSRARSRCAPRWTR